MLLAEHCTVFSRRSRLQRSQPRRRGKNRIRLPIGLTTHGYSLISRAAIRLVERGYSGANVLKRVPSLESYFCLPPLSFLPALSAGHCLCVLGVIDEQPREDVGGQESWQSGSVLGRPRVTFGPEEPSG